MDRYEFMWKLRSLLSDIPLQEREEAIQYYNDYFEDAGKENEADVIASLGSPEKVAETIKKDAEQNHFFDEYEEAKVQKGNEIVEYSYGGQEKEPEPMKSEPEKKRSGGMTALLVILGICASPILFALGAVAFGIFATLFGVVITLVAACIGIVVIFGTSAFGSLLGAVFCFILGVFIMPFHIWAGLAVWGSGFLVGALGLVFLAITVVLCGFVIPKLFQGIGWLFRKCFHRKKKSK